jgi:hypothetical protein
VHPAEPVIDRARVRRQTLTLLLVVNVLVLGIGLVAAVDLRRLRTPEGTALRWVQAAVFGECDDYLRYSVADPDLPDRRAEQELCQDLRQATAKARRESLTIGLEVGTVRTSGGAVTVTVLLRRAEAETTLTLHLVRDEGRWKVLRDAGTCSSVGCA